MSRERVTITIKKDVLKALDKKIDGVKIRNRSHAVESMLSESLGFHAIKDAIVMAGGDDAIKSIAAIKDSLIRLNMIGIEEVIVALGFLGDKIKKGLGDGKEYGLKIEYLEKGEGTGGALKLLQKALKKSFVVVNLDGKLDLDYKMVIDFHKNSVALCTVATNDIKSFKGVYILEPEVTKYIPEGFSMLEEDIFPKLHKENKLNIYPIF